MKYLVLCLALASAAAMPAQAQITLPAAVVVGEEKVDHGGGCRKSSPPGKCCHAGSKPFHCH